MDAERRQQIENLYHSALEHDPARREAFLADACRGDADLRREVESLLAQSGSTGALAAAASTHTILERGGRLGSYEVLGLLGRGGMGEVYSAIDTRLGRKVAIKISHEEFSGRCEREARAISALNHPNICTLHDVGPNYLVMELVEGETLRDLLKRALPAGRSLEIAKQVLDALRAAHHAGIVHRDLKPQNIMVRFDGYVKVLDFGIAKRIPAASVLQTDSTATMELSLPGQILGTIDYMSPEQIQGQEVDQRSDLFAFGMILHEMLTGKHPWHRTSPVDTLHAILHDDPPAIDGTSPGAAAVVRKLLRKRPTERYASAEAVLEALAGSLADRGASAPLEQDTKPLTSIAVLPFLFLSEVEDRKAFSLGFADALITTLGSLEDIAVLPTSAILNYAAGADPAHTCRDLGVRHVLQGNVQKQGAHWRVSTQLFDSTTQKVTYAEKHDCVRENVFEVQDEIGRRVVESLQSRLPRVAPKSRDRYSSDPEAYADFMSGLRESYGDSPEEVQSAAEHLSRAIERDPEFALAHAWLCHVCMQMNHFDGGRTWLEKAERHCERALTLDPDLPEGHWARAAILWSPAKNFQHAEAIGALERVLQARPNFDRAHNRMAAICLHIGRFQEARAADQLARRSNPKHSTYNCAWIDLFSGDFARAREAGEDWFRKSPGNRNALWFSTHALLMAGDPDAAEQRLALGRDKYSEDPLFISLEGMLDARRHNTNAALECVRKALELPSFGLHVHHIYHHVACTYAALGETEKAMAWLEKSIDTGYPCWPFFRVDPYLENLRAEPRFQHLVTALEREFSALKIGRL